MTDNCLCRHQVSIIPAAFSASPRPAVSTPRARNSCCIRPVLLPARPHRQSLPEQAPAASTCRTRSRSHTHTMGSLKMRLLLLAALVAAAACHRDLLQDEDPPEPGPLETAAAPLVEGVAPPQDTALAAAAVGTGAALPDAGLPLAEAVPAEAAATAAILAAQPDNQIIQRCGTTDDRTPRQRSEAERLTARAQAEVVAMAGMAVPSAGATPETVNVYFHVLYIQSPSYCTFMGLCLCSPCNVGQLTSTQVANQIAMNAAYSQSAFGSTGKFNFVLAKATAYAVSSAWFNAAQGSAEERAIKTKIRVGGAAALNVYTWNLAGSLLGWATFPTTSSATDKMDGVVIHYGTVPGGVLKNYNAGDTLVHEAGHWFNLYHTFEGGCSNSANTGDMVMRDTCPALAGSDPIHNYMDYTDDACLTSFTSGQATRAMAAWKAMRKGK